MRIAWIGFHQEGTAALEALIENHAPIVAVFSLTREAASKRSAAADYQSLCANLNLPLYTVENINDSTSLNLLRDLQLDLGLVIGWSQILKRDTLDTFRVGAIGAHASLLPHNRGRAPINWAILNGEERTGNTLMWLATEIDAGDIIDQRSFEITPFDTCGSLYEKVAASNRDMLLEILPALLAGERPGHPQPSADERLLAGRRPEDGEVDWTQPSRDIYNFIRGQTRPYPGAYSWLDGVCWTIWDAALLPGGLRSSASPGVVIGPLISPSAVANGHIVACGNGTLAILEVAARQGNRVLRGHDLAAQPWEGMEWTNGRETGVSNRGPSR